MLTLDLLELTKKLVVLPVGKIGFVEYVVFVARLVEKLPKLLRP